MEKIIAVIIFVVLLPLFVLISFLILVFDGVNPLFTQIRVGKNEEKFLIFKFKTMIDLPLNKLAKDTDYGTVYQQQISRVTKIGAFLRKTSFDELPQLINIANGTMKFVGPRPLLPEQLHAIPLCYKIRKQSLPGITGLAQVKGRRRLGWIHQLKYDRFYVNNKSVLFDLIIIFNTIKVVFFADGIEPSKGKNWREYL